MLKHLVFSLKLAGCFTFLISHRFLPKNRVPLFDAML